MEQQIHAECDRIGLGPRWRETIFRLLQQFETGRSTVTPTPLSSEVIDACYPEDPAVEVLEALRSISTEDTEPVRGLLLSRAIARLGVFHERVRRDGPDGPEFWNPLDEGLDEFLARDPGTPVRVYVHRESVQPDDVLQARILQALTGSTT